MEPSCGGNRRVRSERGTFRGTGVPPVILIQRTMGETPMPQTNMPKYCNNLNVSFSRREFFGRFGLGLGGAALMTLLNQDRAAAAMSLAGAATPKPANPFQGILNATHRP